MQSKNYNIINRKQLKVQNNDLLLTVISPVKFNQIEVKNEQYSQNFSEEIKKQINQNFINKQQKNSNLFNGNIVIIKDIIDENNNINLSIIPTKYADYLAMQDGIIPFCTACGVEAIVVTKDDFLIIGSRDLTKNQENNDYLVQIPSGYIDSNEEQLKKLQQLSKINENNSDIKDFFINEALREANEELCEISKKNLLHANIVGNSLIEDKNKQNKALRSFFVLLKIDKTLDEIKKERQDNPPKDYNEMTAIEGISLDKLVPIINDNFNIEFDCQKRKFAGNIEFALQLLADYIMNNYINQNIKIEKLLSTNFNKINKNKNI